MARVAQKGIQLYNQPAIAKGVANAPLDQLPFLKSLCWQGQTASIAHLSEAEILQIYELALSRDNR